MGLKMMYIVRGLSGSGKSTIAQHLSNSTGAEVCEADDYFVTSSGEYDWDESKLKQAHDRCYNKVLANLEQGKDVIISNTSLVERELKPYLNLAKQYGYNVQTLLVQSLFKSTHDVAHSTMLKQKQKLLANVLPLIEKYLGDQREY